MHTLDAAHSSIFLSDDLRETSRKHDVHTLFAFSWKVCDLFTWNLLYAIFPFVRVIRRMNRSELLERELCGTMRI